MNNNRMLITAVKENFTIQMLIKKAEMTGTKCEYVPSTLNDIYSGWKNTSMLGLYMEEGEIPDNNLLNFIKERLREKDARIILLGSKAEVQYVKDRMPGDLVYDTFPKPIDYEQYMITLAEYFKDDSMRSILIIDDDPQYLSLVREWLRGTYKVSMANSGMQAIKLLSMNKVDLILLDYEMPVTSGPQVLEMLRSDVETMFIPVMFLTGKRDRDSVMEVLSLRPEGYFLKTIQKPELLERLQEFFETH